MIGHNPARLGIRRVNSNIWTPEGMSGLINWLPLGEGAASAVQLIPDLVTTAGATYRGATVAVEATDPTWTAEGLSFDGGDYCNMDATGPLFGAVDGVGTVVICAAASPIVALDQMYVEGNSAANTPMILFGVWPNGAIRIYRRLDGGGLVTLDSTNIGYDDSAWRTYGFTMEVAANYEIFINGVSASATATNPGLVTVDTVSLGAWRQITVLQEFTGSMAYVLRFDRVLADSEIATVHNYIRARVAGRGITLPAA